MLRVKAHGWRRKDATRAGSDAMGGPLTRAAVTVAHVHVRERASGTHPSAPPPRRSHATTTRARPGRDRALAGADRPAPGRAPRPLPQPLPARPQPAQPQEARLRRAYHSRSAEVLALAGQVGQGTMGWQERGRVGREPAGAVLRRGLGAAWRSGGAVHQARPPARRQVDQSCCPAGRPQRP